MRWREEGSRPSFDEWEGGRGGSRETGRGEREGRGKEGAGPRKTIYCHRGLSFDSFPPSLFSLPSPPPASRPPSFPLFRTIFVELGAGFLLCLPHKGEEGRDGGGERGLFKGR